MAEYVSAIVGLVAFGLTVSNRLHNVIDTLRNAPKELRMLTADVDSFQEVLTSLDRLHETGMVPAGPGIKAALKDAREILKSINTITRDLSHKPDKDSGPNEVSHGSRAKLLLRTRKIQQLRRQLGDQKVIIANYVAIETLYVSQTSSVGRG